MSLLAPSLSGTGRFHAYGPHQIDQIAQRYGLPDEIREAVRLVSKVLPFRVTEYVLPQPLLPQNPSRDLLSRIDHNVHAKFGINYQADPKSKPLGAHRGLPTLLPPYDRS